MNRLWRSDPRARIRLRVKSVVLTLCRSLRSTPINEHHLIGPVGPFRANKKLTHAAISYNSRNPYRPVFARAANLTVAWTFHVIIASRLSRPDVTPRRD